MTKDGKPYSRRARRKKGKKHKQKSRGGIHQSPSTDTGSPSSPVAWDGVESSGGAGGGGGGGGAGGGTARTNFYAKFGRPHPPAAVPPPRNPEGLLVLRIPGFRPRDAQRAAWVGKGGYVDPAAIRVLRGEVVKSIQGKIVARAETGAERPSQNGEGPDEEPGWKQRRRRRLLAAGGVVESRDREALSAATVTSGEEGAPSAAVENAEEMDSVWDFATRSFPSDPREVRSAQFRHRGHEWVDRARLGAFAGPPPQHDESPKNRVNGCLGYRQREASLHTRGVLVFRYPLFHKSASGKVPERRKGWLPGHSRNLGFLRPSPLAVVEIWGRDRL